LRLETATKKIHSAYSDTVVYVTDCYILSVSGTLPKQQRSGIPCILACKAVLRMARRFDG